MIWDKIGDEMEQKEQDGTDKNRVYEETTKNDVQGRMKYFCLSIVSIAYHIISKHGIT